MRLKATVSYDGSGYAGWQRQDNALGIESVIMQVLERIHHHPVDRCRRACHRAGLPL